MPSNTGIAVAISVPQLITPPVNPPTVGAFEAGAATGELLTSEALRRRRCHGALTGPEITPVP